MFLRRRLYARHPIASEGALIGVVEYKTAALRTRMSGAGLEFRRRRVRAERQIHQIDSAVRNVRRGKALMRKKFRIGQKFALAPLGAQDAYAHSPLRLRVPNACHQQIVCVAVSLHRSGDPQAVDVDIAVRLQWNPRVFRRNVFDEALAAFLTPVKYQPFIESLLHPFLFAKALLAGHGAADMLPIDILSGDADVVHAMRPPFKLIFYRNCKCARRTCQAPGFFL